MSFESWLFCSFDTTHWRFGVYIPGKQTWLWDVPPPGQGQVRQELDVLISPSIWLFQGQPTCVGWPSHRAMPAWGSSTQEIRQHGMKNILWFYIINYIELNGVLSSPNQSPSPKKPLRQTKISKKGGISRKGWHLSHNFYILSLETGSF